MISDPGAAGRPQLLHSSLLATLGVPHAFTTRRGGVSRGIFDSLNFGNPGDLPPHERDPVETIRANRASVFSSIGAASRVLVEVHQVHGAAVHILRAGHPDHAASQDAKADALVTDDPSRLIAVRVADCTPILLASLDGSVVAAVHAGWRGVISGVLPAAISAMRDLGARDIHAAIGPCISAAHFEVGPEVAAEFTRVFGQDASLVALHPRAPGKWLIDLKAALLRQSQRAGLSRVDVLPHCTVAMPDLFYSHRRDAGRTGRMMAVIGPRAS